MQWCKPKRISTGFPMVKISFCFSWFTALSLVHWDVSAIRPIAFGTAPSRLVHCIAPEPLSLLIHGTLASLHQEVCVPLYYLLSFSSVLPPREGNTQCVHISLMASNPFSLFISFLVLYFFPGQMYISVMPFSPS